MENNKQLNYHTLSITEAELMDARNDLLQTRRDLAYYQNYALELLGLVEGLKSQLAEIYASKRWKITQPIWSLKEKTSRSQASENAGDTPQRNASADACMQTACDFPGKKEKNILFVDRQIPKPDRDAGSRSVFQYISLLVEMGYTVKFLGDETEKEGAAAYRRRLAEMGVDVLCGGDGGWAPFVLQNAGRIGFVVLNRPNVAVKYVDFFRENLEAKIVYLGCDLHFLRELRDFELTKDPAAKDASERIKIKEFIAMRKADVVVMYGAYEKKIIRDEFGIENVLVAPVYYIEDFGFQRKEWEDTKDILFVGGFAHKPNIDAAVWFCSEIWNRAKELLPGARLVIAGSDPTAEIQALAEERTLVTGFIPDGELQKLYARCRVCVAPLRFGAGIKGKTVEAMKNGIPLVTTSVGIEGLDGIGGAAEPADTAEAFLEQLVEKYNHKEISTAQSDRCREYVKTHFGRENLEAILREVFKTGNTEQ